MLQTLRDKSSGWIATTILVLLMVPFAFFGMEQYLFQRNVTFAAKIEAPPKWWPSAPAFWPVTMLWQRDEIDADEFRNTFEQERQRRRSEQGEQFDVRAFESVQSKREVLDGLIDQRVLRMAAAGSGMEVGDTQVRAAIQAIPAFQVDGKFDAQRYQLALASQVPQRSPREFEQLVRESLQQSMIPTRVSASAFVTKSELDRLLKLLGEKRDVSYVVLPPPAADTAAVSAAEIQRWYASHAARYRAPETVSLEYVDVDAGRLPAPAAASEAALRQRYEQEQAKFGTGEQRLVSHILVEAKAGADAAALKAAEQKAARLATQAKAAGADFAALARANSDDAGSKAGGGDLGSIEKNGAMVKPFEDAVFAAAAPGIVGPVKTDFGYHVIQVREIRPGQKQTFEQVRAQLAAEQAETDRERGFNDALGKLVDEVYKNPTTLAPAARLGNLPVQKLGPIARSGNNPADPIASNPAVLRAAFAESAIQDGTVSDPIEIAPGRSVLLRVTAHKPERTLTLAQVRDRVIAEIRVDRTSKAAAAAADALLAEVRAGKPLADVASARKLASVDMPAINRGAPAPDPAASEAMFAVPAPATGKVSPGKVALADGRMVVFAVRKATPADLAQVKPAERALLQQQLSQVSGMDDAEALVRTLRKQMKVTVAEDRL